VTSAFGDQPAGVQNSFVKNAICQYSIVLLETFLHRSPGSILGLALLRCHVKTGYFVMILIFETGL
jgi:hypothetical protein